MLTALKILEYSLFVAIYRAEGPLTRYEYPDLNDPTKRYSFAIIDFFEKFKRIEKKIIHQTPKEYADRFIAFIRKMLDL